MLTTTDWDRWMEQANAALAAHSGSRAQWWGFGRPCCTFQLVVGDPVGANVAIMLCNCRYLKGPTIWSRQALHVSRTSELPDSLDQAAWVVEDRENGFRAVSGDFMWAENIDVGDPNAWRLWRPEHRDRTMGSD